MKSNLKIVESTEIHIKWKLIIKLYHDKKNKEFLRKYKTVCWANTKLRNEFMKIVVFILGNKVGQRAVHIPF